MIEKSRAVFRRQDFSSLDDRGGSVFEDLEFDACRFYTSNLSITTDPSHRTLVRNVLLRRCHQTSCTVFGAVLQDVTVEALSTHGVLDVLAAALQRVVFRGRVGRVMISPDVGVSTWSRQVQAEFDTANRALYEATDWAIDISLAEFDEFQVDGIPARLIRRDPETQVCVTKAKAQEGTWVEVDLTGTWWPVSLRKLAEGRFEDTVLVAPKRNKKFPRLLEGLRSLQKAGIAEPD